MDFRNKIIIKMTSCEKPSLGAYEISLGIVVTTVLVLSYIPQIYKLIKTKNSYGISPYAQVLSLTSQTLTLFNIILLQQGIINCCIIGKYGVLYCLGSLMGVIQVFLQWSCIATIAYLFVIYFPSNINSGYTAIDIEGERLIKEWKLIVKIVYCYITIFAIVLSLTLTAIIMDWSITDIEYLAGIFGLGSTFLSTIQFLPQIRKTYVNKSVGALSIPSMLIQCPGSFILVVFLAIQPGTNWTTWITYFAGGTLQGILLSLCIYYYIKNKDNQPQDECNEEEEEEEEENNIENNIENDAKNV